MPYLRWYIESNVNLIQLFVEYYQREILKKDVSNSYIP